MKRRDPEVDGYQVVPVGNAVIRVLSDLAVVNYAIEPEMPADKIMAVLGTEPDDKGVYVLATDFEAELPMAVSSPQTSYGADATFIALRGQSLVLSITKNRQRFAQVFTDCINTAALTIAEGTVDELHSDGLSVADQDQSQNQGQGPITLAQYVSELPYFR